MLQRINCQLKFTSMKNLTFYHAGCPVCVSAEEEVLSFVDSSRFKLSIVHLGEEKSIIPTAKNAGVKSVPALVTEDGQVLHINFGAGIDDI